MLGEQWARKAGWLSEPTQESIDRGFGPGEIRTALIRQRGRDLVQAREVGSLSQAQLAPWYAKIAEVLV